jgi:hypothetical protein
MPIICIVSWSGKRNIMDTSDIPQVYHTVNAPLVHRGKNKDRRNGQEKPPEKEKEKKTEIREEGDHVDLVA